MNVTGHLSIDGVRSYKRMSEDQYQEVSSILQGSNVKKAKVAYSEPQKEKIPPIPATNMPLEGSKENIPPIPAKSVNMPLVPAVQCQLP